SCEHGTRRVTRTEYDGSLTVLVDRYQGKPLNAPNDVVVHPDGGIWFTDPGYGRLMHYEGTRGEVALKEAVYRIDPHTGALALVTDALAKPNGLCFSPDYQKLYIVDTGVTHNPDHPREITVWDVIDGQCLRHSRTVATMVFEGMQGEVRRRSAHMSKSIPTWMRWETPFAVLSTRPCRASSADVMATILLCSSLISTPKIATALVSNASGCSRRAASSCIQCTSSTRAVAANAAAR